MQAHLLFQKISPTLGQSIIVWIRDHEKEVYKAIIATLAQQKKLRPEFIKKKTREAQITWILETLKSRLNEGAGENILQVWLMKGRGEMLASFLDSVGIPHDGKGGVEGELPNTLEAEKVKDGIAKLLETFPADEVVVYLNLFQLQQLDGWPEIAAELESNPKLAL